MADDGLMIKTKAAVAWKAGEPLKIEELDLMPPKAGEVLIHLEAAALCHTDAYTLSGRDPEGVFPSVLGHEGSGIVQRVGEGVQSVAPGDHVIPLYTPECKNCKFCKSNKSNLCQAIRVTQGKGLMPDGTTRFFKDGKPIYHYMGTSCFSEFIVVPEIAVAKIPKEAPLKEVCLLGCGVTTGLGAVRNTAKVEKGANVAVFGLGAVGLSVLMGAKMAGAAMIIAVDIDEGKFDLAKQMGATHCLNPKNLDVVAELISLTDGGVDYSFECIGNVKVMRQALEACHKGWGESIIIGVAGAGEEISTRPFQLVTGRVWRGSAFGGVKGRSQLPQLVSEFMKGEFTLKKFITHTMPIEKINEAIELLHSGKSLRTILTFH